MKNAGLSELEELTLLIVVTLGPDAYSVPIQAKLEKDARRPVALGAVYAALDRLERKGYATSAFGEATPQRGGKRKRMFAATSRDCGCCARHARRASGSGERSRLKVHPGDDRARSSGNPAADLEAGSPFAATR